MWRRNQHHGGISWRAKSVENGVNGGLNGSIGSWQRKAMAKSVSSMR